MSSSQARQSGITLRSFFVMIFCLAIATLITVFLEMVEASGFQSMPILAHQSLAIPALGIGVILILLSGLTFTVFKTKFLTRAELICVIFAMLVALPLVTAGFWMRYLGTSTTDIIKKGRFEWYDAVNPNLWPHDENLTENWLAKHEQHNIQTDGNVMWEDTEFGETSGVIPTIDNPDAAGEDTMSTIRIPIPLYDDQGKPLLMIDTPYMFNLLARSTKIGGNSLYSARIYYDDAEQFSEEIFANNGLTKVGALHPHKFSRVGRYGIKIPERVKEKIVIELALRGPGTVSFADLQIINVDAIESAYTGRLVMPRDEWKKLPENQRAGVVVEPESWFSINGLKRILTGYMDLDKWKSPLLTFYTYFILIALGCYAMFAIMRKQWIQNERYPLPVAQAPMAMLGINEDLEGKALPALWKNRAMWLGFAITFFWCVMRGWAMYNKSVPDMSINVNLAPYFSSPGYGRMWSGVNFSVVALFVGLALFMELNVLISLAIGFFLFRSQYWVGKAFAFDADPSYPYLENQILSAYITYFILILIFTRRYMWRVVKEAVGGKGALSDADEAMSFRGALILLLLTIVGSGVWAMFVGFPVLPMVIFFVFALAMCFVAAKLRAECGTPTVGIFTAQIVAVLPLLGGWKFFGLDGFMFVSMASLIVFSATLFVIPALELEFIQIARRAKLKYRHLFFALIIGITGGFFFGGWAVMNPLYALGEENVNSPLPYLGTNHAVFGKTIGDANAATIEESQKAESKTKQEKAENKTSWKIEGGTFMMGFAAVLTLLVTVLRQIFAGFWFHPIAIILGPTGMLNIAWGSILFAWFIRFMVLKLGGAVTVRRKLMPFATGMILAVIAAYAVFGLYSTYLYFFDPGVQTQPILF